MSMHNKSTLTNTVLPLIASLYSGGVITSEQRINLTRLARSALAGESDKVFEFICELEQNVSDPSALRDLRDAILLA